MNSIEELRESMNWLANKIAELETKLKKSRFMFKKKRYKLAHDIAELINIQSYLRELLLFHSTNVIRIRERLNKENRDGNKTK